MFQQADFSTVVFCVYILQLDFCLLFLRVFLSGFCMNCFINLFLFLFRPSFLLNDIF